MNENWLDLEIDNLLISYQVDTFHRLLQLVDEHLDKEFMEWEGKAKESIARMKDREDFQFYEDDVIDGYVQRREFKDIFFHSLFVTLFASFEQELLRCCELTGEVSGNPFSVKDFGGRNYCDSAKTYLKKLGVAFPTDSDEWRDFTTYRKLRNCLLHQGGSLAGRRDIVDYTKEKEIVSEGQLGLQVTLTKEFCEEALQTYYEFFRMLNQAHSEWCLNQK